MLKSFHVCVKVLSCLLSLASAISCDSLSVEWKTFLTILNLKPFINLNNFVLFRNMMRTISFPLNILLKNFNYIILKCNIISAIVLYVQD